MPAGAPSISRDRAMDHSNGLKVALLGDLAANDRYAALLRGGECRPLVSAAAGITSGADLVIANLEACWDREDVTRRGAGAEKIRIRTVPQVAELLRCLNVSVVSSANNHGFDFGLEGWEALTAHLSAVGIRCVGGGRDAAQAAAPLVIERRGVRVGLLAYADRECGAILADAGRPGANALDEQRAVTEIEAIRAEVDLLVVSLHWGLEKFAMPTPGQRKLAAAFAEAGADIITGHHPHVLQGYEKIGTTHVFYSLGNFLMANVMDGDRCIARYCGPNYLSAIPTLRWERGGGVRLEQVTGIRTDENGIVVKDGPAFKRRWRRLCGYLRHAGQRYEKRFARHQAFMWRYYIPFRYRFMADRRGALQHLKVQKLARLIGLGQSPYKRSGD